MNTEEFITTSMNVRDDLKDKTTEEIRAWQLERSFPVSLAMSQFVHDFNFAGMVRNGAFFGAREIHMIGPKRRYDKRGAVGAYNYINVIWHATWSDFFTHCDELDWLVFAVENNVNTSIPQKVYPNYHTSSESIFLFGEEGCGLPLEVLERCNGMITIPGIGCTRSLNVATTSGIILAKAVDDLSIKRKNVTHNGK